MAPHKERRNFLEEVRRKSLARKEKARKRQAREEARRKRDLVQRQKRPGKEGQNVKISQDFLLH